jgi:hypothetical protein
MKISIKGSERRSLGISTTHQYKYTNVPRRGHVFDTILYQTLRIKDNNGPRRIYPSIHGLACGIWENNDIGRRVSLENLESNRFWCHTLYRSTFDIPRDTRLYGSKCITYNFSVVSNIRILTLVPEEEPIDQKPNNNECEKRTTDGRDFNHHYIYTGITENNIVLDEYPMAERRRCCHSVRPIQTLTFFYWSKQTKHSNRENVSSSDLATLQAR